VVLHLRTVPAHVLAQDPPRALAGAVGHGIGGAAQAEHRGDVDDRAATRRFHRRDRGLAAEEGAQPVDVIDAAVFGERAVLDRVAHAYAGRVQETVQAAERLDGCRNGLVPGRLVGDVEGNEVPGIAELLGERAAFGLVAVGQHRLAALADDQPGGRGANARGAPAY